MKYLIPILSIFLLNLLLSADIANEKFSFSKLVSYAEDLSKKPYQERISPLPESLQNLTYSQYNLMRYNIENDLWVKDDLPFRISFFPLGTQLYSLPVEIYQINYDDSLIKSSFSSDLFQYNPDVNFIKEQMPKEAGFAGFKIRYNPKDKSFPNEFISFLGNSYFRAICNGSSYGLSNRGIAINTGLQDVAEEFPAFEKFFLKKPRKDDASITVYALLNGKSLTGAYSMNITPGKQTEIEINSVIFVRNSNHVELFCLAPITSMFWFTLGQPDNFHDYRPSVHNSEGLILKDSDKFMYGSLSNYPLYKMINNDISCNKLQYFGLIQRNREYNRYMDPGVKYHLNPDCTITPLNEWGKGKIRLFILPTLTEWMDNINLFWIPDIQPEPEKPFSLNYKIVYSLAEPDNGLSYARYTNLGTDLSNSKNTIFALSYQDRNELIAKAKDIKINLEIPEEVTIVSQPSIEKIEFNNTWRVLFSLTSRKKLIYDEKPFIIKCTLESEGKCISEQWRFLWYPL
ncbi:MAG TPA: hypothetical protein DD381_04325 [Lentisphaeria bacterium]|nr:MAG: hypothetical protein A2X47_07325 [Lentisphaerae bacterium GWF2_38_69]HBM15558.1 hypothetical protein [Lentisphaeria bacterium]